MHHAGASNSQTGRASPRQGSLRTQGTLEHGESCRRLPYRPAAHFRRSGYRWPSLRWGPPLTIPTGPSSTPTRSLDVIAHELTHGVTQYCGGLDYQDQSSALNESISDVFGSLTKQYTLRQTAEDADWLIGAGVLAEDDAVRKAWSQVGVNSNS
ncbi:M4 family metallopeptidase [Streptomyces bluensis]|uniref:M4 family metallopeptidase n=1 Tax=Streptomyces bluensis TaxID=33897 RepID=UPI0036B8BC1D